MTTDTVTPLLRGAVTPTLIVGAVTVLGGGLLVGLRGALGALLGVVVVVLFSGLGLLVMRSVRTQEPLIAMTVAMASYAGRIVLFGAALLLTNLIGGIDEVLDRRMTAIAVLLCVIAWVAGEIRAFTRLRVPTYDIDLPDPENEETRP